MRRARLQVLILGLWAIVFHLVGWRGSALAQYEESLYEEPLKDEWDCYYSFRSFEGMVSGGNHDVYAWTAQGILHYNIRSGEVRLLYKGRGLMRGGIQSVAYCEARDALVVAYRSGAIDVLDGEGRLRSTFTELEENVIRGIESAVVTMEVVDATVYCLTSERVYSVNLWDYSLERGARVDGGVLTACRMGEKLYVGTQTGIKEFVLLLDGNEPRVLQGAPSGAILHIVEGGTDVLYAVERTAGGVSVWIFQLTQGWRKLSDLQDEPFGVGVVEGTLYLSFSNRLVYFTNVGTQQEILYAGTSLMGTYVSGLYKHNNKMIVSTLGHGLLSFSCDGGGSLQGGGSVLYAKGPHYEKVFDIESQDEWVVALNAPWEDSVFSVYTFHTASHEEYSDNFTGYGGAIDLYILDVHTRHFLITTQQKGLLEVKEGQVVAEYTSQNAPFVSDHGVISLCGVHVDTEGRWWVYDAGSAKSLVCRTSAGQWSVYASSVGTSSKSARAIFCNHYDGRVILSLRGAIELMLFSPSTLIQSQGEEGWCTALTHVSKSYTASEVHDVAVGVQGGVYVAGHDGLLIATEGDTWYETDRLLFSSPVTLHPENPEYEVTILAYVPFQSIVEAPGGRIWAGSQQKGLFQLDLDEKSVIRSFSVSNSLLSSPNVTHLHIPHGSDYLYIGTPEGLLRLHLDASLGEDDLRKAYVYPNPVRPEYHGSVAIDGLMEGTIIKITDAAGRLVRELESEGGRALWDLKNDRLYNVGSGVYFLFCVQVEERQKRVLKLVVVR